VNFHLVSAMPEACIDVFNHGVVGRAFKKEAFKVHSINPRSFASGVHQPIDDRPFGGGDGMLSLAEPFAQAIESIDQPGELLIFSPQGDLWSHELARDFSKKKNVTLVCPRYAGMDYRLTQRFSLREISVGNYILSGGEMPAGIIIDSIVRFLPGVLGHSESADSDSFGGSGGLEAPSFTRPREWRGLTVPETLLSGNHKKINTFNAVLGFWKTLQKRPNEVIELEAPPSRDIKAVFDQFSAGDFRAINLSKETILSWNREWKWW